MVYGGVLTIPILFIFLIAAADAFSLKPRSLIRGPPVDLRSPPRGLGFRTAHHQQPALTATINNSPASYSTSLQSAASLTISDAEDNAAYSGTLLQRIASKLRSFSQSSK